MITAGIFWPELRPTVARRHTRDDRASRLLWTRTKIRGYYTTGQFIDAIAPTSDTTVRQISDRGDAVTVSTHHVTET